MSSNANDEEDIVLLDEEEEEEEEYEEDDDRSNISDLIVSDSEVEREIELARSLDATDDTDGINIANIVYGRRTRSAPTTYYDEYKQELIDVLVSDDEQLEDVRCESMFTIDNTVDPDGDDDDDYVPDDE